MPSVLSVVIILISFLSGSLPFSVWIGRLALGKDIRSVGDANPGATNVFRAGGKVTGIIAVLLDMLKGSIPVGIAYLQLDMRGWNLVAVALAPILGHAFSPFLNFKGGKAVAVTGGVWMGLTLWEGPTIAGIVMGLLVTILPANGWVVIAAQLGTIGWLLLTPAAWNGLIARPTLWEIALIGVGGLLILAWKHRTDLTQRPRLKKKSTKSQHHINAK